MVDRLQVVQAFQTLLGRVPESEAVIASHMTLTSFPELIAVIMAGREFQERYAKGLFTAIQGGIKDPARVSQDFDRYMSPNVFERYKNDIKRVILLGQCAVEMWRTVLQPVYPDLKMDHILFGNRGDLPSNPPYPFDDYDFQVVHLPIRSVVPDYELMRLNHTDLEQYEAFFDACVGRLEGVLDSALVWSARIPTLVANFLVPQQNPMGRLAPRYDLRNLAYFVSQLNVELQRIVDARPNVHVLDADNAAAVYGRRFVQDDAFWIFSHGSFLGDYDAEYDVNRLELVGPLSEIYNYDTPGFIRALWNETVAIYRTIKGVDAVKMVCVDLDDTLWRGIIGEAEDIEAWRLIEGWPLGFSEALLYLKARGIILAIISKNNEDVVRRRWAEIFGPRLELSDFAIIKINWEPKAENIAAAIAEANVLPNSVVFIDDNPVERAAVTAAFPDIRVLGAPHYFWRQFLLWSPETQTSRITEESARRTDMIKAQVLRESDRARLSRSEFLHSLDLKIELHPVSSVEHPRFPRSFELINKTNQFNTTGERWSHAQAEAFFAAPGGGGRVWWTFDVTDRHTRYGLVGVLVIDGGRIEQFVMSCRVFGLDVEIAVLSALLPLLQGEFSAIIKDTPNNQPCRSVYEKCGWTQDGELWRGYAIPSLPDHITIKVAANIDS